MNPGKLISLEPLIRDKEQTDNHTATKEEKDTGDKGYKNMAQNKKEKQNDKREIKYKNREKRDPEVA